MPAPTLTWLLDKNVARRAIEGISAALTERALTYEQSEAIRLIALSRQAGITLAITPEAANILERRPGTAVRLFLTEVTPWRRGRYWARWVRRLREYGFSSEHAAVLSHATFGLDEPGQTIGVMYVITFDFRHPNCKGENCA